VEYALRCSKFLNVTLINSKKARAYTLKIPAMKKGDLSQVYWVDIRDDLLLLTAASGIIEIETEDGVFELPQTVEQWASILKPYDFARADRNAVVKLNRIVGLDRKRRLVYVGPERNGRTRKVAVSNARWRSVQQDIACSEENN